MVYKARIPGENASVRHSTTKSFPKEASSKKHSVASHPITEPLSKSSSFEGTSETQSNRNSVLHCYKIEDMRQSETAWVLFTRHMTTKQCFVMKILK